MDRRAVIRALGDGRGPVALVFAEIRARAVETLAHHLAMGFERAILFAPEDLREGEPDGAEWVRWHLAEDSVDAVVTAALGAARPGRWIYWGFGGEFLYHPFQGARPVTALLAFAESERRESLFGTVVDLYRGDNGAPAFDRAGYFAEGGGDGRAPAVYGGLRRRFSEHVPHARQRIDRIPLLRARPGLGLGPDLRPTDPALDSDAAPWHRTATVALASWRASEALARTPSAEGALTRLAWPGSDPFDGTARQLLEHGLMEPGQWF